MVVKRILTQVAACALLLPVAAFAADPAAPAPPPAVGSDADELSEVLVSGERATRKVADLIPWIRRLLGEYAIEGHVDLGGKADPEDRRMVRGHGICVGFGVAPGVQCEIHVNWRGPDRPAGTGMLAGVSYLTPAMILYGVEPDDLGIRFLQVDNRGLAEGATGLVVGDTASFTTRCVDAPEGCQRITRITAPPDSKQLAMQVDTTVDGGLVLRYQFELTRVAEVQAPEEAAGPGQ